MAPLRATTVNDNPSAVASAPAEVLRSIAETTGRVRAALGKVIVGQQAVVDDLLVSLLTGGHVLLEGVPGLAKTTLVSVLASAAGLEHARIQFTPDLLPGDILGSEVLEENRETGERQFRYVQGPVFTQVLLADEINRTPPKTQAALLQAMQEKKVSYMGKTYPLPFPFAVYATQNPIENEGTYPLPEAQLDRFMLKVVVDYPSEAEERSIALINPRSLAEGVGNVVGEIPWRAWYDFLDSMPLAASLVELSVRLVRASRPEQSGADDFVRKNVRWGAGPRASQHLLQACRGRAALEGLAAPTLDHLKKAAYGVLRHRIIPSFSAEAGRIRPEAIIAHLIEKTLV